jgi:hypothetical protein
VCKQAPKQEKKDAQETPRSGYTFQGQKSFRGVSPFRLGGPLVSGGFWFTPGYSNGVFLLLFSHRLGYPKRVSLSGVLIGRQYSDTPFHHILVVPLHKVC